MKPYIRQSRRRRPPRLVKVTHQEPDLPVGWRHLTDNHLPVGQVIGLDNQRIVIMHPETLRALPTRPRELIIPNRLRVKEKPHG